MSMITPALAATVALQTLADLINENRRLRQCVEQQERVIYTLQHAHERPAPNNYADAVKSTAQERDEALAELAEARAVLVKLEWWHDDREHVCLSCHNLRSEGHAPDCALAAALGKEPPMPTGQEKL